MSLLFSDHVIRHFAFLISKYQCQCVSSNERLVRYENDLVFVNVRFDNGRSYELGVEIGQKNVLFNGQEMEFNLGEIIKLKDVENREKYTLFQVSDQELLVSAISNLAELIDTYGAELLQGNQVDFSSLAMLRRSECDKYEVARKLEFVRSEVDEAWKAKDYKKVVQLYRSVDAHITLAEKMKLEYAIKQQKQSLL
jgi:hypothetical protein